MSAAQTGPAGDDSAAVLQVIDQTVLGIMQQLLGKTKDNAAHCVGQILDVSAEFLSKEAHKALRSFYDLYFGGGEASAKQEAINDEVSRLFDAAQAVADAGGDLDAMKAQVQENASERDERLSVSALQKQLEVIISLEDSFRGKMAPVLSGMQFEDAMSQRLTHLEYAWSQLVALAAQGPLLTYEAFSRDVAAKLSADQERALFYPTVLGEEAPEGLGETSIWVDLCA